MTLAERECLPVGKFNGWPTLAQFAFRQKDGTLKYYQTNPRSKQATRNNDGSHCPIVPGRNSGSF